MYIYTGVWVLVSSQKKCMLNQHISNRIYSKLQFLTGSSLLLKSKLFKNAVMYCLSEANGLQRSPQDASKRHPTRFQNDPKAPLNDAHEEPKILRVAMYKII